MTQITTRQARASDAPRLTKMVRQLAAHHDDTSDISEEELIFLCFGPSPWLTLMVAERDGQLLGYAALQRLSQLQFAKRTIDVHHLFVAPHLRGQGAGRALMAAISEFAALNRCSAVTLGVMAQNDQALGFYKGLGFEVGGEANALKLTRALGLQSLQSAT